jgi:hypothetical protein
MVLTAYLNFVLLIRRQVFAYLVIDVIDEPQFPVGFRFAVKPNLISRDVIPKFEQNLAHLCLYSNP